MCNEVRLAVAAEARAHAPCLEIAADGAGGDLAIGLLAGQPGLDIVGLLRGKAHITRAQGHDAIGNVELSHHRLGAGEHALVLVARCLRRGDRDELAFPELVLAQHAARIAPRRAGFRPEARRQRGESKRQFFLGEDRFAHEIGERDLGGGDEPAIFLGGRGFEHAINEARQIDLTGAESGDIRLTGMLQRLVKQLRAGAPR